MAAATRILLLALVLASFLATPAKAWTRARITSAKATVAIDSGGQANVKLDLVVDVDAGWLAEFEVTGLDRNLSTPSSRLRFRSREGGVKVADVLTDPATGTIRASFDRASAPRRGTYDVSVRYDANMITDGTETIGGRYARVHWTMPAWEHSLEDAQISFVGPRDMHRTRHAGELPPGTTLDVQRDKQTRLMWRRVHLPRSHAWSVDVDVPLPLLPAKASKSRPVKRPAPAFAAIAIAPTNDIHWPTVLLVLLVLWKRVSLRDRRMVLRSPAVVGALIAGAGAAAVFAAANQSWQWLACVAALLCCASTGPRRLKSHGAIAWAPTSLRRRASPARPGSSLDITTIPGLLLACLVVPTLGACGYWIEAALILAVFLLGTRFDGEPTVAEQVALLRRFCADLRFSLGHAPIALQPIAGIDGGQTAEVRVAFIVNGLPTGLESIELVIATQRLGALRRRTVALHVATRAESPLDDVLRPRLDAVGKRQISAGVHHWLVPPEFVQDVVELCQRHNTSHGGPKRESGTWFLRAIRNNGANDFATAA